MGSLWLAVVSLVAFTTDAPAKVSGPSNYAPVYTHSGTPGMLVRIGSFRYKAIEGFDVLYCTIENTASRVVQCVIHTPQDRLILLETEATEHKT